MKSFKTSTPVHYYEINKHREASPVSVLNYLEEAAIRHSETVGCGVDKLLADQKGWMLTRWSLHMERYPKWNEMVFIETWPHKFERFYATREFKITGDGGELLGAATTLWVFFDLDRKRPVRIPKEIADAYGTGAQRMVEDQFNKLPLIEKGDYCLDFKVRLSDIDTNNHVNNKNYVEWILETIPEDIHNEWYLAGLEVAYKKETKYGSEVSCETGEEQGLAPNGTKKFVHVVKDKEEGKELATSCSVWVKRKD